MLAKAGMSSRIDVVHAMAHKKIMIIDGNPVITGLFQLHKSARDLPPFRSLRVKKALGPH